MVNQHTVPDRDSNPVRERQVIEKFFGGRKLVVATKHQKEKVLKPVLEQGLGVKVAVARNLDTDEFGTFSGEVEREGSPLETARRKCEEAYRITGESLVIASEGSFGAHPVIGFVPADEEILLLKDFRHGIEIKTKLISTQTNFAGEVFTDWESLLFFASKVHFPSHGLILRTSVKDHVQIHKGITTWEKLKSSFYYFKEKYGQVYAETDMRALYNPTRMKVIEEAAEKLLSVIGNLCPVCEGPGFEVREVIKGLPCSQCSTPTHSARANVHICQHCGHSQTVPFPSRKEKEDPMFCEICNP